EHVLADEEVGVVAADVADEVDQAEAALLQQAGVRADHLAQLVAPGVLEAADRDHLVELARELALVVAEVGVHLDRIAGAEAPDLPAHMLGLRAGGVDARYAHAVVLLGVQQETAKP